jgi:hypothetical protein
VLISKVLYVAMFDRLDREEDIVKKSVSACVHQGYDDLFIS